MRQLLFIIGIFAMLSCNQKDDKFYMPAEWEQQDAVWLGWQADSTLGFYPVVVEIIKTLTPHVTVKIAFDNDSLMQTAKSYLTQQKVDTKNIKFYLMPGDRHWIRDNGAAFLVNNKGQLGVADFGWNHYGFPQFLKEKYNNNQDSANKYLNKRLSSINKSGTVDSLMAVAEGAKILTTNVVTEGGNIEVNGKGTLIVCEAAMKNRNPDLNKEFMESELKNVLGVSKVIWLKRGLAEDPNGFYRRITENYVGGGVQHSDEFVRFSNANTILLAWVDESEKDLNPINKMNYERLNESYQLLKNATDQDGKPFTIIKVPLPDLTTKKIIATKGYSKEPSLNIPANRFYISEAPSVGDSLLRVPASSYMNYLVTNGLVLVSSYVAVGSSKEKEDRVCKILKTQFPNRKIVFINAMPQNWDGGGIHCSTQQQPSKRP
ncbi:agmatine deiminase family protein [Spirosoma panaciterrae]|uniref:agmatine deiminase family protein n=1 Tax=Spirosoma panaciterrae TaxID=496058 RepID=UPI000367C570|nr:agmatine deiminase family protein [Spirosoma panaciterrae]